MEFDTAKTLFAVGLVLSIIPPLGLVLALIGAYGLSRHYSRRDIFWNMLYAAMVPFIFTLFLTAGLAVCDTTIGRFRLLAEGVIIYILTPTVLTVWALFVRRAYMNLFEVSNVKSFKTAAKLSLVGMLILPAAILLIMVIPLLAIEFMSAVSIVPRLLHIGFTLWLSGIVLILVGHIFAIIGAFRLKPPT